MNILFLSTENPFPPDHGHHIRTYNTLYHLAKNNNIYFIGFVKSDSELSLNRQELEALCVSVDLFVTDYSKSRFLFLITIIKSILKGYPFSVYRYFSKKAAKKMMAILEKHIINIIHIDMLHLAIYKNLFDRDRLFLTDHNVEFLRLKRWMKFERNILKKAFLFFQYLLLKRFEIQSCKEVNKCFVVSDYDKQILAKLTGKDNFSVIPNGVDTKYFKPISTLNSKRSLVWTGSMSGPYNKDAVIYFITKIWERVKKENPDIRIVFVGKDPPQTLIQYSLKDPQIILVGYVNDVRKYMARNNIFVAPLRCGSGTKIKILNAMAMGLPVITTSIGAEGLEVKSGEDIIIADTPAEFAFNILKLWRNDKLSLKIGSNARKTAEEKYDWNVVLKEMDTIYESFAKCIETKRS